METKHLSRIPFGQLAIIAMDNCRELGEKVNKHIVERRKSLWQNLARIFTWMK